MIVTARKKTQPITFYVLLDHQNRLALDHVKPVVVKALKHGMYLAEWPCSETATLPPLAPTGCFWFRVDNRHGPARPIDSTNHPLWAARPGTPWDTETVLRTLQLV